MEEARATCSGWFFENLPPTLQKCFREIFISDRVGTVGFNKFLNGERKWGGLDGESGIAEIKTPRFTTLSLTRHFWIFTCLRVGTNLQRNVAFLSCTRCPGSTPENRGCDPPCTGHPGNSGTVHRQYSPLGGRYCKSDHLSGFAILYQTCTRIITFRVTTRLQSKSDTLRFLSDFEHEHFDAY